MHFHNPLGLGLQLALSCISNRNPNPKEGGGGGVKKCISAKTFPSHCYPTSVPNHCHKSTKLDLQGT